MKRVLLVAILFLSLNYAYAADEAAHEARKLYKQAMKAAEAKDYQTAIAQFKKTLELNPSYAGAYMNLGIVYKNKEEYDSAIECLNKALAVNPDLSEAYSTLGAIYEQLGQRDKAVEYSKKALTANQNNPVSIYNLGYSYILEEDRAGAIAQYERLKSMNQVDLADKLMEKINKRLPK